MTALLGFILDGVEGFGTLVLWGGEQLVNAVLAAFAAAWTLAAALLPSMGDSPALGNPQWLGWLNWFFPVGELLALLTSAVGIWVSFLAIRYLLRLIRAV